MLAAALTMLSSEGSTWVHSRVFKPQSGLHEKIRVSK